MKYINYFLNKGLNIRIKANGNLGITGLSSLQSDTRGQVLQYAKENKWRIVFELETQNKTIEKKLKILWDKADKLGDWIDNPNSEIHWQERTKYVPEVLAMSDLISELETGVEVMPDGGKKYKGLNGVWYEYQGDDRLC